MTDKIRITPQTGDWKCDVHDWPTRGLGRRLVATMRASPKGVEVCRNCVVRDRDDAKRNISMTELQLRSFKDKLQRYTKLESSLKPHPEPKNVGDIKTSHGEWSCGCTHTEFIGIINKVRTPYVISNMCPKHKAEAIMQGGFSFRGAPCEPTDK